MHPHPPTPQRPLRRYGAGLIFVISWTLLHGGLLAVLSVSAFVWIFVALLLVPLSYGLLFGWYRPDARTWGIRTCGGYILWLILVGIVSRVTSLDLFSVRWLGLMIGFTTMPLLPQRGHWRVVWPLINMLGWSSAGGVFPRFSAWTPSGDEIVGCVMAGALYGLITGPALAILLQDDQPRGRTEGADGR
jgi:hypothetical protein